MSIMMQSSNQQCNALQTLIRTFLHSCNTPENVVKFLAHVGLSISTTAVNSVITSLSKESVAGIQRQGRSLLTAYAYDNIDIDLKHATPTIEKSTDTLIHLTSGTLIPLDHGITHGDLNCSKELWDKSKMNRLRQGANPSVSEDNFLELHPEDPDHPSGLMRRDRFNILVFLQDLIHHGPEYFRQFSRVLEKPETIDQIPVVKSKQIPAKMMDISPSTPAANADALADLFRQGGVGDSHEQGSAHVTDLGNQVVLVHGDLLTGERIQSLQASRSEEATPWNRYQFVIYVMGLFHLKMACANAIWRIFIQPPGSRTDLNSLLQHIAQIWPRETGKIETKPGFQRMHEAIQHVGIVSRLDCWRLAVEHLGFKSLDTFALSRPGWAQLNNIARRLAENHVAVANFAELWRQHAESRDVEFENMLLRQQHFLLYEEITYTLNEGDIGRVEDCYLPWIFIFRSCGKHKYASHMMKYLRDVHYIYPPGLKSVTPYSRLARYSHF